MLRRALNRQSMSTQIIYYCLKDDIMFISRYREREFVVAVVAVVSREKPGSDRGYQHSSGNRAFLTDVFDVHD